MLRFAVTCLFVAFAALAYAGPAVEQATEAERLLSGGKPAEAYEAIEKALDSVWSAMPLTLRRIEFVTNADGFGKYTLRPDHAYKPGEKLLIYMEPVGYAYGTDSTGGNVIGLSLDLELFDAAGQSLGRFDKIAAVAVESNRKARDFYFNFTLDVDSTTIPAGKYRGDFTLHDANSDKTAAFSLDFEILPKA